MRTVFSIFAFVGFFASILVHSLTCFRVDVSAHVPWVWALHLGCFIAIIPLIGKDLWRRVIIPLPVWAKSMAAVFAAYVFINGGLAFIHALGGTPDIWDGRFVLHQHGTFVRELSDAEYHVEQAYVLRGFSGHWMIFYLLPALYSWYRTD